MLPIQGSQLSTSTTRSQMTARSTDCNEYVQSTNGVNLTWLIIVLHPRYKTFYFLTVGWEQTWIDEALRLLRLAWTSHYKPQPAGTNPTTPTVPNTSQTQSSSRVRLQVICLVQPLTPITSIDSCSVQRSVLILLLTTARQLLLHLMLLKHG